MIPIGLVMQAAPVVAKLLSGGKLDGLKEILGDDTLSALKGAVGDGQGFSAEAQVLAAISTLAQHLPADAAASTRYLAGIKSVTEGLAEIKAALAK